jgi:hypothetical protein
MCATVAKIMNGMSVIMEQGNIIPFHGEGIKITLFLLTIIAEN